MKFSIGMKVVCVNDYWEKDCVYRLKKGVIYTIDGFYKCECGSDQITLHEIPYFTSMICRCNRCLNRRRSYYTWRFVPLEGFENEYSSSTEDKIPEINNTVPEQEFHKEYFMESSML